MISSLVLLARVLGDLGRNLAPLIGYAVLFHVAALVVLGPATVGLLAVLIETTGYGAVGNQAIAAFLLSPAGLAAVLAWAVLALATAYLEQAGFLLIVQAASRGRSMGPLAACLLTARRLPALLELGARQAVWFVVMALPFLGVVGVAYLGLWANYDLYYLTTTRPPEFWIGASIAALMVSGYAVVASRRYLLWLVALPILLRARVGPAAALRTSVERMRGRIWRNLAALAIGAVGLSILGGLAAWGFDAASETLLRRVGPNLKWAVPVAGALLAIHVGLTTVFQFAGAVGHALLTGRIDAEAAEETVPDRDADPTGAAGLAGWSPRYRELVVTGVLVLGGLTVSGSLAMVGLLSEPPWPTITAHRGASREAPENTVAAIRAAIAAGADAAEIDVRLSADGAVVVLHDEDLRRLNGDRRRVADLTLAELRRVDAGSHFNPSFRGKPVPTLEEVLDAAGDRLGLNIELKVPTGADPAPLARRVLEILANDRSKKPRWISSLSISALSEVRRREPDRTIGFIIFEALGDTTRLDVDFLSVRASLATSRLVAEARRRGRFVAVWTVGDLDLFDTLASRGVADILTDDPRSLVAHRRALADLEPPERLLLWYRRAVLE